MECRQMSQTEESVSYIVKRKRGMCGSPSVKHPVSCQDFLSLEHTWHTLT